MRWSYTDNLVGYSLYKMYIKLDDSVNKKTWLEKKLKDVGLDEKFNINSMEIKIRNYQYFNGIGQMKGGTKDSRRIFFEAEGYYFHEGNRYTSLLPQHL